MTPKDDFAPVSSHEGLSPLSGPNINEELGKSTADKGPDITVTLEEVTREMVALHNPQHQGVNNQLMFTDACWVPKDTS